MKTNQELEQILRNNFNNLMPGIRFKQITFEQFKREYPSLMKVIIKSMKDVCTY